MNESGKDRRSNFPEMHTPRLTLREFRLDDAPGFFSLRSDETVMRYMDREPPESLEIAKRNVADTMGMFFKQEGVFWALSFAGKEEFIGYAGYHKWKPEDYCAELACVLATAYHRQGLMTEAVIPIINHGFGAMKLHRIEASVNPLNTGSIKLLEKMRFQREGVLRENIYFRGRFLDSVIYGLLNPADGAR